MKLPGERRNVADGFFGGGATNSHLAVLQKDCRAFFQVSDTLSLKRVLQSVCICASCQGMGEEPVFYDHRCRYMNLS